MHDLVVDVMAVAMCGALGGFVSVFIGDSGLHLPVIEEGVFRPGYIGGARWFKAEAETTIFRKTAAVAASKSADSEAAATIAAGTPLQALTAANRML